MGVGPIPPIQPITVTRSPERRQAQAIFSVENATRTDDERYTESGGKGDEAGGEEQQSGEFAQELSAAEQQAEVSQEESVQDDESAGNESAGNLSFFA